MVAKIQKNNHNVLVTTILDLFDDVGEPIRSYGGALWNYRRGAWVPLSKDEYEALIEPMVRNATVGESNARTVVEVGKLIKMRVFFADEMPAVSDPFAVTVWSAVTTVSEVGTVAAWSAVRRADLVTVSETWTSQDPPGDLPELSRV